MIPIDQLVTVFNSMLGWPYASPGYNDARGIDCSGAFVYAYSRFGERIYHGSNRIIRVYCNNIRRVTSLNDIRPGMAIFKAREDLSRMKAEYKPGGRYYDPMLPYDYYHVGLVTSVAPLKIFNATPPAALEQNVLSAWYCVGYLNAVDYAAEPPAEKPTLPPEEGAIAVVMAESGGTVNLRRYPDTNSVVLRRVPIGTRVSVLEYTDNVWWKIRDGDMTGYMMREFLCDCNDPQ